VKGFDAARSAYRRFSFRKTGPANPVTTFSADGIYFILPDWHRPSDTGRIECIADVDCDGRMEARDHVANLVKVGNATVAGQHGVGRRAGVG
jgi:hypothetical protein